MCGCDVPYGLDYGFDNFCHSWNFVFLYQVQITIPQFQFLIILPELRICHKKLLIQSYITKILEVTFIFFPAIVNQRLIGDRRLKPNSMSWLWKLSKLSMICLSMWKIIDPKYWLCLEFLHIGIIKLFFRGFFNNTHEFIYYFRQPLVDFANLLTKKLSLLICAHVEDNSNYQYLDVLKTNVQLWLKDHNIKAFFRYFPFMPFIRNNQFFYK